MWYRYRGLDEVKTSCNQNQCELSEKEPSDGNKGQCSSAVFNVLDTMLKDSLDRLKTMWSVVFYFLKSGTSCHVEFRFLVLLYCFVNI